ncbi:MAG: hypothetical protein ACI89X_002149 [Planctomycetota bacterium]|jgi:hypothetical protein
MRHTSSSLAVWFCRTVAATAVAVCAAPVSGQSLGTWVELPAAVRPAPRKAHGMVYDAARNETVMFGGESSGYLNDTWVFGSNGWVQKPSASSPAPRRSAAMAYDPVRQCVVLFGGHDGNDFDDIWEWDGASWTQVASGVPGVVGFGSAVYNPLLGGVFFSRNTTNLLWNGVSANVVPVAQPMGNQGQIVYDASSGGVLRKSGQATLVFSVPQGWQQVHYSQTFGTSFYAIAHDPIRNRIFLQSGNGQVGSSWGSAVGHTWQWVGGLWAQVSGVPPALVSHAMVFDFSRDTFVIFGGNSSAGLSDTTYAWVDAGATASYEQYGLGCSGTLPVAPRLEPDPLWNTAPVLGGVFLARIDQLAPGQLVVGAIGVSDQVWNGVPLPFALTAFGMQGCELLAAPDVVESLGVASATGERIWPTAIPNSLSLSGFEFFQQALAFAPTANPAGVVWSNGGHGTVGL